MVAMVTLLHVVLSGWMTRTVAPRSAVPAVVFRSITLIPVQPPGAAVSLPAKQDETSLAPRPKAPAQGARLTPPAALPAAAKPEPRLTAVPTDTRSHNREPRPTADGTPRTDLPVPAITPGRGVMAGVSTLILPDHQDRRPRQKSYAEQANAQLNPQERRDRLAEGIKAAGVPDCLKDGEGGGGLIALPVLIYKAANGQCK